jgi:thymidylate synthase
VKTEPYIVQEKNVSLAWAKVMLRLLTKGMKEISPLIVNIDTPVNMDTPDGEPVETSIIRQMADEALEASGKPLCLTTANTIFPKSLWVPGAGRELLFSRYERALPRLRKVAQNRYGIYFERLIRHGGQTNQLRHILDTWAGGNHRRSALQALTFDPAQDHTNQRMRGFPCLQQVMFLPDGKNLTVSGVYGVQYIFDRAYGNYLGLCSLGQFMAHEMGLRLTSVQCVTTIAELGDIKKSDLGALKEHLSSAVEAADRSVIQDCVKMNRPQSQRQQIAS